jgi:transcriptional regulator with XRE-family HTH domain
LVAQEKVIVMSEPSDPRAGGSTRFADLLNYLFASHLSPRGKPYTLKEVSDATGGMFSIAYLSLLRHGGIERPSLERTRALADFFGVDVSYFLGEDPTFEERHPEMEEALRRALADPQIREFALRLNEFSTSERTIILNLLNQNRQLIQSMRARETTTPEDGGLHATPAADGEEQQ